MTTKLFRISKFLKSTGVEPSKPFTRTTFWMFPELAVPGLTLVEAAAGTAKLSNVWSKTAYVWPPVPELLSMCLINREVGKAFETSKLFE